MALFLPGGMIVRVGHAGVPVGLPDHTPRAGAVLAAIDPRDAFRAGAAAGGAGHVAALAVGHDRIVAAGDARYFAEMASRAARVAEDALAGRGVAVACAPEMPPKGPERERVHYMPPPPAVVHKTEIAEVGIAFTLKVSGKTNVLLICKRDAHGMDLCSMPTTLVMGKDHDDVARRLAHSLTGSWMHIASYAHHDIAFRTSSVVYGGVTTHTTFVRRVYVVEISEGKLVEVTCLMMHHYRDEGARVERVSALETVHSTKKMVVAVGGAYLPVSDNTVKSLKILGW